MARHISNIDLFIVSIKSMLIGLRLTLKHFFVSIGVKRKPQVGVMDASYFMHKDGIVTNLYPHESIPVPDNGRYRLHNEVDDCIVCDLCAKVCPVNCIDIEPIKSPVEIGKTSDGSTKRIYAATFDIDMAKCCFCGLCTTVCPTECLTMTKTYDFSEYNVSNMVYHFAELSPAEGVLKKEEMEKLTAEEKAKKSAAAKPASTDTTEKTEATATAPKPTFKPKAAIPAVKKPDADTATEHTQAETGPVKIEDATAEPAAEKSAAPKPVFKPKVMIPAVKKPVNDEQKEGEGIPEEKAEVKAVDEATAPDKTSEETAPKAKPVMKPVMKPVVKPIIPKAPSTESTEETASPKAEVQSTENTAGPEEEIKPAAKPKPVMKPVMKPVIKPIIPKKSEEGGEPNA